MTTAADLAATPRLLDAEALARATMRLAHEIRERHPGLADVVLAGVLTRGVPLAARIRETLSTLGEPPPPLLSLDISDYRDDRPRTSNGRKAVTALAPSGAEVPIDAAIVVVVDDVLYTGRTLRAALDALADCGRPASVEPLVLIDRGHRELPLRATYVGKNVPTSQSQRVTVRLREIDGIDGAWLVPAAAS
jgi:pyrimidine operon attenuation protein / uracil phosphoribosyltransferase